MANDSENLAGATVQMAAVDFEQPTNGNNDPAKTLDREKLELDTDSIDRLSVKPVQKYRFIRSIGRGGMKMVLQMKDQDATRDVAMAVLPEATTRPKEDLVRFIQEARITASLEHPNIVPVHEIGVDSTGAPYYTMKLLRGRTLAALISSLAAGDERAISEYKTVRLLRIFLKICSGVAFAHSKGVIHLDLKPDNIQVGDFGEVLILDWGLAKVRNHEEQKESGFEVDLPGSFGGGTLDGVMKGTPGYMAPEQAAGRNSQRDERTDVYALGAILYTMMTWKDPLEQKSVRERIDATLAGNIIPPGERAPEREIPAGVEAVIRKAMSLKPADRYQSVRELRDEVNAFIGGYATVAEKASIAKKTVLFFRRHILLTVILSMLLFFASVSALYMVQEYRRNLDGWKQVFVADFRKGGTFHAAAPGNGTLRPVRADGSGGVLLNSGEWLWLDHDISGNLKLEVTYTVVDPAETEFDLVFDAKDAPLATVDSFPAGWCLRLAANGGWDILGRTEMHSGVAPLPRDVKKSSVVPGKNTVTLVRENNRIRVFSGVGKQQKQLLEAKEVTIGQEKSLRRIGFRSLGTPVKITDVRISRLTVPSGPAQLYRAQILAEEGLYERAFEQYLTIAGLYPNDAFADEALIRAYALASFQLVDQPDFREKIRGVIESCPAFSRAADVAELDAMFLWHTGRHQEALVAAAKILSEQPDHPIVTRFLLLPRQKITDNNARNLFRQLVHSKAGRKLTWLDLSGLNLTGLDDIEKLEDLRWLNCSQNRITTLKPLKNTKLEYLDCSGNSALRNQEIPIPVKTLIKD